MRADPSRFDDAEKLLTYLMAGCAIVTLTSRITGNRYTYRVERSKSKAWAERYFVSVLTGPNNETDYHYIGQFFPPDPRQGRGRITRLIRTKASRVDEGAPVFQAMAWLLEKLRQGRVPDTVDVAHSDHCGRCGRRLTVPESIEAGYGPECLAAVEGGG